MAPKIVIIGGGWAGLAAAIQLTAKQIPVTLIEASDRLGGRARRIQYHDYQVDNGQHLIIGAYRELLRLLDILGIPESQLFQRKNFELNMKYIDDKDIKISLSPLPAHFHTINGFIKTSGLALKDHWQILKMCLAIIKTRISTSDDISVKELLTRYKQATKVIKVLWEPMCLATMNTPLHEASAEVFITILHDAFMQNRDASDLLFASANLDAIIPEPAFNYIQQHNGRIILNERITQLNIKNNRIHGISSANGNIIDADYVIIAIPSPSCLRLIRPHTAFQKMAHNLEQIEQAPICTVYLQYPAQTRMSLPMIGSVGTTTQWVFDRSISGQPGLMAVVISAKGSHMAMNNQALCNHIENEIAMIFPDWPKTIDRFVIREKQATFKCSVGINALRPQMISPIDGCLLAGDYTATGYPSTLEGALRSGVRCAEHIIKHV